MYGFLIFTTVIKFIKLMKQKSSKYKFRQLNKFQFSILND